MYEIDAFVFEALNAGIFDKYLVSYHNNLVLQMKVVM